MVRIRKRLNTPKTWGILRKSSTYVVSPLPSGIPENLCIPISEIIRGLGLASTLREIKFLLRENTVLVDGTRVSSHQRPVGLFNNLEIPSIEKRWVILLRGRKLSPFEIEAQGDLIIPIYVINKRLVRGGQWQVNFFGGRNLFLSHEDASNLSSGDLVYYNVVQERIEEHQTLGQGVRIFKGNPIQSQLIQEIILPTYPRRGRRVITEDGNYPLKGFFIYPQRIISNEIQ